MKNLYALEILPVLPTYEERLEPPVGKTNAILRVGILCICGIESLVLRFDFGR